MPKNQGRPFAYAVDKTDYVFAIRPTLALAIESARERFDPPSFALGISAWFPGLHPGLHPGMSYCVLPTSLPGYQCGPGAGT